MCPKCGWDDIRLSRTPDRLNPLRWIIGLSTYRCDRCGHRFSARARPQVCPNCRTVNNERLGWCEACGGRLPREGGLQRWEPVVVTYLVVAVLLGLVLSAVLFLIR